MCTCEFAVKHGKMSEAADAMLSRVLALFAMLAGMKANQQDTGVMARVEGMAIDLGPGAWSGS